MTYFFRSAVPPLKDFLTFVLLGGSVLTPNPVRFFRGGEKQRRSAPRFLRTLSDIFSTPFLQILSPGYFRSGHEVGSSGTTSNIVCDCAMATVVEWSIWNFQDIMRLSGPTKRISQNFFIDGLRSGQFCDLPIIRQWEKIKAFVYPSLPISLPWIMMHSAIIDDPGGSFDQRAL